MARTVRRLLTVVFLGGVLALPAARAQAPATLPDAAAPAPTIRRDFSEVVAADPLPEAAAPAPPQGWEPEFLKSLPRPPAQPLSLFQPAPALVPPPPDLEHPYFELDSILDPPQWGVPSWFTNVEIDVIHPHIFAGELLGHAHTRFGQSVPVAPGAARLNWTAAPRLELGYRLGSGFGGFAVADRFFSAAGSGPFSGPVGDTSRVSRLIVNYTDFDYFSHDYTPWDHWTMIWRVGLRQAETYMGNRVEQSFSQAASGLGVISTRLSNETFSMGPHVGVALVRQLHESGLAFVSKFDIAETFARVHQGYSATLTNGDRGISQNIFWQEIPILNFQVGLGWKPPSCPNVSLYAGYVYEMWWQVGTNSNFGVTSGSFNNQGVVLQGALNY